LESLDPLRQRDRGDVTMTPLEKIILVWVFAAVLALVVMTLLGDHR
jgi:hypothetical protein